MIFENDNPKPGIGRKRFSETNSMISFGKLPPQAIDLEESILGALMLEKDALMQVVDILKPETFYRDAHQKIFESIRYLFEKNNPVDILTVTAQLRQRGELEMIGGAYYITELTNRVASAANIEYHARIVIQKYMQRELIRVNTEVISYAYDDTTDILDLLEKAEKQLLEIGSNRSSRVVENISDIAKSRKETYRIPIINGLTGIASGLTDLDKFTHGWQKTDLVIIAARPAMGKTALALQCARYPVFDLNKPVVIFSLEMSSVQLTDRIISSETGILLNNITTHDLDQFQLTDIDKWVDKIESSKLFIDDTPSLTIYEFRAKCRRLKASEDIQLIIVDYLQLMNGREGKDTREQQIGNISRALKAMAKELNVPVIALSQLSRANESRPGAQKRPMLSDLRESGSIEQDADLVIFLHRDEYYGISHDAYGNPTEGVCEAIIAKHRNGETGVVKLDFNGAKMRFKNYIKSTETKPYQTVGESHKVSVEPEFKIKNIDDDPPF